MMVNIRVGRMCEYAGSYECSDSLSTLELPGRGLAIAGGANMIAAWSIHRWRRAYAHGRKGEVKCGRMSCGSEATSGASYRH
jgi:hypothetical protein